MTATTISTTHKHFNMKQKTKLIIRRLPYDYTNQQFHDLIQPYITQIDYIWFEQGHIRLPAEQSRHAVGYVNVTDAKLISQLVDVFVKTLPGTQVEFAPNQRIYRRGKKERRDKLEDTIEDDEDYKSFVASLKQNADADKSADTSSPDVKDASKDVKEEKTVTGKVIQQTPIVDFLLQRDKARSKAEKASSSVEDRSSNASSQSKRSRQVTHTVRAVTREEERKNDVAQRKKSAEKRSAPIHVTQQPAAATPTISKPEPKLAVIEISSSISNPVSRSPIPPSASSSSQRGRAKSSKRAARPTEAWVVKASAAVSAPTATATAPSKVNVPASSVIPSITLPLPTNPHSTESTPRQSQPEPSSNNRSKRGRGGRPVAPPVSSRPNVTVTPIASSINTDAKSGSSRGRGRGRSRGVYQPINKSADTTSQPAG